MSNDDFGPPGKSRDSERNTEEFDRWGRYKLPDPVTGEPAAWTRATTLAKTIDETFNLEQWKLRMVAHGIGLREDLYALVAALDPEEDKSKLQQACSDAMEAAKSKSGANLGTALHGFTDKLDRTGAVDAPAPWRPHVEAYRAGMRAYGFSVLPDMIERQVVCPALKSAGRTDRVGQRAGDALPAILDLKTEKGDFAYSALRTSIQMAIYANATHVWDKALRRYEPMPLVRTDIAYILHLPSDAPSDAPRFAVYEVDIERGWRYAQLCLEVREARKAKRLMRPLSLPTPASAAGAYLASEAARSNGNECLTMCQRCGTGQPVGQHNRLCDPCSIESTTPAPGDPWLAEIATARSRADLGEIWRRANALGAWRPEYTAAGEAHLAEVLAAA